MLFAILPPLPLIAHQHHGPHHTATPITSAQFLIVDAGDARHLIATLVDLPDPANVDYQHDLVEVNFTLYFQHPARAARTVLILDALSLLGEAFVGYSADDQMVRC